MKKLYHHSELFIYEPEQIEGNNIMVFLYHHKNLVLKISSHETFHINTFLMLLEVKITSPIFTKHLPNVKRITAFKNNVLQITTATIIIVLSLIYHKSIRIYCTAPYEEKSIPMHLIAMPHQTKEAENAKAAFLTSACRMEFTDDCACQK